MTRLVIVPLTLALAAGFGACGGGGSPASVDVALSEWQVSPESGSVPAGDVRFTATNSGTQVHQLVVIRTDVAPEELPSKQDGSINESRVDVVGKVDGVAPGGIERMTFALSAGQYVLACNIVDTSGAQPVSHYQKGMRARFTVSAQD